MKAKNIILLAFSWLFIAATCAANDEKNSPLCPPSSIKRPFEAGHKTTALPRPQEISVTCGSVITTQNNGAPTAKVENEAKERDAENTEYKTLNLNRSITGWGLAIIVYILAAGLTFLPTLIALLSGVKLKEGGASFEKSNFSEEGKIRLINHFSRLQGTLGFWKKQAVQNQHFHYYCLWWTIISSSMIPFLSQSINPDDPASKWLLTVISVHTALLLAFHRGLKVAERFKAFRHGESEYYDLYRRFLDRSEKFGPDETTQITKYFEETEMIRKFVRNAETDSLPSIEDVKEQMTKAETKP